jgi:hypothetical protein
MPYLHCSKYPKISNLYLSSPISYYTSLRLFDARVVIVCLLVDCKVVSGVSLARGFAPESALLIFRSPRFLAGGSASRSVSGSVRTLRSPPTITSKEDAGPGSGTKELFGEGLVFSSQCAGPLIWEGSPIQLSEFWEIASTSLLAPKSAGTAVVLVGSGLSGAVGGTFLLRPLFAPVTFDAVLAPSTVVTGTGFELVPASPFVLGFEQMVLGGSVEPVATACTVLTWLESASSVHSTRRAFQTVWKVVSVYRPRHWAFVRPGTACATFTQSVPCTPMAFIRSSSSSAVNLPRLIPGLRERS